MYMDSSLWAETAQQCYSVNAYNHMCLPAVKSCLKQGCKSKVKECYELEVCSDFDIPWCLLKRSAAGLVNF